MFDDEFPGDPRLHEALAMSHRRLQRGRRQRQTRTTRNHQGHLNRRRGHLAETAIKATT